LLYQINIREGLKWLATIQLIALVHIPHVPVTANAVSALHITAEVEKCQDASSPNPVKRPMTGRLKISIKIIRRIIEYMHLNTM
jgi:hypothetical protein